MAASEYYIRSGPVYKDINKKFIATKQLKILSAPYYPGWKEKTTSTTHGGTMVAFKNKSVKVLGTVGESYGEFNVTRKCTVTINTLSHYYTNKANSATDVTVTLLYAEFKQKKISGRY